MANKQAIPAGTKVLWEEPSRGPDSSMQSKVLMEGFVLDREGFLEDKRQSDGAQERIRRASDKLVPVLIAEAAHYVLPKDRDIRLMSPEELVY